VNADSSYMNIRFETLQQAQDDLGAAYAAIQATVENLETQLNTNLSQWTGSAQDSYRQVKLQWNAALDHMASVLQKAQVHIGNAAEMYQAVENQNTSIWHS
jgi:WXG100 family type VII secretion target